MNLNHAVFVLWLASASAFTADALATNYTFTKIAHTSDGFLEDALDGFSAWTGSSINDSGTVAFVGERGDGRSIFLGDGATISTLIGPSATLNYFESPRINNAGQVAFMGGLNLSTGGIYDSDGTTLTTIGVKQGSAGPSINDAGVVVFKADSPSGGAAKAIYRGSGGPLETLSDGAGQPNATQYFFPEINASGLVAYSHPEGIAVYDGVTEAIVAPIAGQLRVTTNLDVNDSGVIAFEGGLDGEPNGIYLHSAAGFDVVATTDDGFSVLGLPSLNNSGEVAFLSSDGIFTGPDRVLDKVIAYGDPLFGSSLDSLGFSAGALNNAGQVVFFARLLDGTSGVFRADPVTIPEPASLLIMCQVAVAFLLAGKRGSTWR